MLGPLDCDPVLVVVGAPVDVVVAVVVVVVVVVVVAPASSPAAPGFFKRLHPATVETPNQTVHSANSPLRALIRVVLRP
jgi:hypothetical protein